MEKYLVLCLIQGRNKFVESLCGFSEFEVVIDDVWDPKIIIDLNPSIVISVGESNFRIFKCFVLARKFKIPTLNIQDGIHEWRDMWTNKDYSFGGKYFNRQFLIADKILCLGQLQADWFTAMGMTNQPVVIGVPWLDDVVSRGAIWSSRQRRKKVLIATANTPSFNEAQHNKILNGLIGIYEFFRLREDFDVIWRLRGRIADDLNFIENKSVSINLTEDLSDIDFVLSTPSTVVLETMLMGIPVALVDFTNSPSFIFSAWRISTLDQINEVINEISNPSHDKLYFQRVCLNLMVYCKPNASKRFKELILDMIFNCDEEKSKNEILSFGGEIKMCPVEIDNFNDIFPNYSYFHGKDDLALKLYCVNLKMENDTLRNLSWVKLLKIVLGRFRNRIYRVFSKGNSNFFCE